MPEKYINEFTLADGIDFGDEWPIQRRVGGVWKDYVVPNLNMFGVDVRSKTVTYDIQDLVSSAQDFESAVASDEIYVLIYGVALYTPGTVNDGMSGELLGQLGYEPGGDKAATCRFIFNGSAQGSPLGTEFWYASVSGNNPWRFSCLAPGTTSNGTITVWAMYSVLSLP